MNTDIRLSVNFFNHIKTLKLERRCGKEGVLCLLKLWVWAAVNRPSGDLSGYCSEDLELFCGWTGESGCFTEALRDIGWLDDEGKGNSPRLHGWGEFQTWVTDTARREAAGRLSILAKKNYTAHQRLKAAAVRGITREQYAALIQPGWEAALTEVLKGASELPPKVPSSPIPIPIPSPSPYPSPTPKRKYSEAKRQKAQKAKNDETRYTDLAPGNFERQWDGEFAQKASPLDYIRKIREIAENAPKIPERKPGFNSIEIPEIGLESEESTNGKEQKQNDGRRAA